MMLKQRFEHKNNYFAPTSNQMSREFIPMFRDFLFKYKSFCCAGDYISNGFLKVSCNGGLNQMRAAVSGSFAFMSNFMSTL